MSDISLFLCIWGTSFLIYTPVTSIPRLYPHLLHPHLLSFLTVRMGFEKAQVSSECAPRGWTLRPPVYNAADPFLCIVCLLSRRSFSNSSSSPDGVHREIIWRR
ncbi:hypothetical protein CDAR_7661 [Caerostris darwini]|uniref:Secreted protein n=1 Tax=Caerostris darwini TaxID=1538125 RepID=A0AAV4RCY6_9ARAC|nr:hypothetical protein CDAR_7661 [Caerostris darwini]